MTTQPVFNVGISFHSFSHNYVSYQYSFEDMMEKAAQLGGGVEIVGPSHHRGFPEVTDEFERVFKSAVQRYGLTPTSYGSYADPFMLPDRDLTPDEIYEYTIPQLKGAARLGFPVVRLQYFAAVAAERLVPVAEKLNIWMGYELHSPLTIESKTTQELIAQIKRISSERLGLIPDCGIFARSVSENHINSGRKIGIPGEIIQEVLELWDKSTPVDDVIADFRARKLDEKWVSWVDMVWGGFGRSEPSAMLPLKEYIKHVHGKFYTLVDGDEPNLRYEDVVKTLLEMGYTGWMSTEYEGAPTDAFAIAKAHQDMIKRYIQKYTKN
ncbi:MAG: sugar phosphate isomerase/epimerase [Ardenticatenaceae bacterium]|nr:sugar phosphate isomerase/epimerase [Ardenticatenaceae bacterium]MCB9443443.1 sugar phosphate isomerase/epimerase [Ardenticatenaceae bacterium]